MRFTLICVCILIAGNEISGTAFTLTSVLGSTNDPNLPDRCYGGDLSESLKSGANDMVIVPQTDGTLKSTPLQVRVGKLSNWRTIFKSRKGKIAKLYINNVRVLPESRLILSDSGSVFIKRRRSYPSCTFTNDELQSIMSYVRGRVNEGLLVVDELDIELSFKIHILYQNDRMVITDVDGTITKSDIGGFIGGSILGRQVSHPGVVEFFERVSSQGYIVVYLTARPIAFDGVTREYLFGTLQNVSGLADHYSIPNGPLFLSPISAEAALTADADVMKRRTIKSLLDLFDVKQDVVEGAYGNKNTDTEAYLESGIREDRVFQINETSKMINVGTRNISTYNLQKNTIDEYYPKI